MPGEPSPTGSGRLQPCRASAVASCSRRGATANLPPSSASRLSGKQCRSADDHGRRLRRSVRARGGRVRVDGLVVVLRRVAADSSKRMSPRMPVRTLVLNNSLVGLRRECRRSGLLRSSRISAVLGGGGGGVELASCPPSPWASVFSGTVFRAPGGGQRDVRAGVGVVHPEGGRPIYFGALGLKCFFVQSVTTWRSRPGAEIAQQCGVVGANADSTTPSGALLLRFVERVHS